jgi:rare lipoprotein A
MLRLLLCMSLLTASLAAQATSGRASWYGAQFHGRKMSNGQRFDKTKYTCASRRYPLGTMLRVDFPTKGTFVFVRVADRGPYVKGRVLDLSERAAYTLGIKPYGVAYVEIEPVKLWRRP